MSQQEPKKIQFDAKKTIIFMIILSLISAIILSVMASALRPAQIRAKELDRSKEMLRAARVMNFEGYFELNENGNVVPAKYAGDGRLSPTDKIEYPSSEDILALYNLRILPRLLDANNQLKTFEELGINETHYVEEYKTTGYYRQSNKLIYLLLPNPKEGQSEEELQKEKPIAYIIPVNGMGLWDAIFGYLAIKPDGDTVIGISWYDQKETPGLGALISEWSWQKQFPGKKIFQASADGKTDFKTASLGIQVVRGRVAEVYGPKNPKSLSAVDGMAGATLTGNGVTDAYHDVLSSYRPFLLKLHQEWLNSNKDKEPLPADSKNEKPIDPIEDASETQDVKQHDSEDSSNLQEAS